MFDKATDAAQSSDIHTKTMLWPSKERDTHEGFILSNSPTSDAIPGHNYIKSTSQHPHHLKEKSFDRLWIPRTALSTPYVCLPQSPGRPCWRSFPWEARAGLYRLWRFLTRMFRPEQQWFPWLVRHLKTHFETDCSKALAQQTSSPFEPAHNTVMTSSTTYMGQFKQRNVTSGTERNPERIANPMHAICHTPKNGSQSLSVFSGLRSVPGVTFSA